MSLARALGFSALVFPLVVLPSLSGCGPTTVDPGEDFSVADVVFDDSYFYCQVEPVLFASHCGPGDPAQGDSSGGCHNNVTSYRLTDYAPLVADTCTGNVPAAGSILEAARQNYQTSQARMKRDPEVAPLLQKPLKNQQHPRRIFEPDSAEAEVIRQWATRFSSQ